MRISECFPDEDFGEELLKFLESDDVLETIPEELEEDLPKKISSKKRPARKQPAGRKQPARGGKKSQKISKSPEAHEYLPKTIEICHKKKRKLIRSKKQKYLMKVIRVRIMKQKKYWVNSSVIYALKHSSQNQI